jgi:hypothetical protein
LVLKNFFFSAFIVYPEGISTFSRFSLRNFWFHAFMPSRNRVDQGRAAAMVNTLLSHDVGLGFRVGVFHHGNDHDHGDRHFQRAIQHSIQADPCQTRHLHSLLQFGSDNGNQGKIQFCFEPNKADRVPLWFFAFKGGFFVLTLLNTFAVDTPLIVVGLLEVTVIAWIYGNFRLLKPRDPRSLLLFFVFDQARITW